MNVRVVLAAAVVLAACSSPPLAPEQFAHRRTTASSVPPASGGLVIAVGHGWTKAGLDGPRFPAGTCHVNGKLPDARCTPGAIDAAVNQANLQTTICRAGYTQTVRPPTSLTGPAKKESLREYGVTGVAEYDHLVPLELGGASDTRNLWPEPGAVPNVKDRVENGLHARVCAGTVPLVVAQAAIAGNWVTAPTP